MLSLFRSSLSVRFLIALGGVLLLAMLALALISAYLIRPALLAQEATEANASLDRIERTFEHNKDSLLAQARDWANWDDTYRYMQGEHPGYEIVNFSRDMFEDMHYQLIIFFDTEGELRWVAGLNPLDDSYAACADLQGACRWSTRYIDTVQPFLDATGEDQVLILSEPAPALVAISAILRTDRSGPARGWLAKLRPIDTPFIEQLEQQTGQSIQIAPMAKHDTEAAPTRLTRDADNLRIARRLDTLVDAPPLEITTLLSRDTFRASIITVCYVLGWTVGLLILTITVVLLLLERMVLSPLRQFAQYTQRLHHEQMSPAMLNNLSTRQDEIGTLAREFHSLLEHQRQQSEQLRELTLRDPLIGVANRRLFDQHLAEAMQHWQGDRPIAAMMIDIDHFKLYNDHYGHQAGDACLIALAQCMEARLCVHGFTLARTGGEEFSVLLPNTSYDAAIAHAQELLEAINALALPHAHSPTAPTVTVSIGVAATDADQNSPATLMRDADRAMYAAKTSGRNRVAGKADVSLTSP